MKKQDLIAPEKYNIAMEMEKYAQDPNRTAIIWQDDNGLEKHVTYQQLLYNANKIGNIFLERGLQKGDKILVMMPRLIETYEVYLAALKTGIVIIPSSEMLRTKDLQYRITHGEVKAIVSYYPFVDQFSEIDQINVLEKFTVGARVKDWIPIDEWKEEASEELVMADTSRDDLAFLPYTSGTTGNPKGVMHTHAWGFAHLKTASVNWLCIKEDDIVWATAAPGWQKWVWSPLLSVLGSGATGFVYNGKFNPKKYLQLLQEQQINVLCCTPTEYRLMAKVDNLTEYQLPALHSAVSAGEPLNREVIDIFQRYFNVTVRDGYGQTESTLLLGFLKGMKVKPGSMGKPTPGNEVVLINEDANPVPVGTVGDIAIPLDTPALFKGYYKDEERSKKAGRGNYFVTGDQAMLDDEGYFWFEGRSDDIIVSSGYTIGPFEVEDSLVKHPSVKECAVVASPDEIRGNVVKAYIVLQDNVDQNDPTLVKTLQNHVKQMTAPYKYPRKIEFINELPKTTSGKIRRVELRQREKQTV
ncbi:Acetyl-coenzyme A synthetase [Paraliobacillus sp. PM-2]|uniref:acyl-CoA synthetase MbcS n=1 Tax=Paraliobacillus sp. PM-2 TaxID=1462524 RepID=UPI00061CDB22|nr:acyl--CoA ligase [Paraliobacillus sp. PM-2]CQR47266.1 Acetyl-coenzyme A synthetase [Paraliobacillus sp. PM-2]